jgi:hypothetical protein
MAGNTPLRMLWGHQAAIYIPHFHTLFPASLNINLSPRDKNYVESTLLMSKIVS